jgi:tRNA A37 threonylcarbamoyltransferase TsaD
MATKTVEYISRKQVKRIVYEALFDTYTTHRKLKESSKTGVSSALSAISVYLALKAKEILNGTWDYAIGQIWDSVNRYFSKYNDIFPGLTRAYIGEKRHNELEKLRNASMKEAPGYTVDGCDISFSTFVRDRYNREEEKWFE